MNEEKMETEKVLGLEYVTVKSGLFSPRPSASSKPSVEEPSRPEVPSDDEEEKIVAPRPSEEIVVKPDVIDPERDNEQTMRQREECEVCPYLQVNEDDGLLWCVIELPGKRLLSYQLRSLKGCPKSPVPIFCQGMSCSAYSPGENMCRWASEDRKNWVNVKVIDLRCCPRTMFP